jgi:AcrR family transcriptional regulator
MNHSLTGSNVSTNGSRSGRLRGQKTRLAILRRAVDIASVEGLEGLTIGKLATALKISKSGLFAHFGSKEELQIAVVNEASHIFAEAVIRPANGARGIKRLQILCDGWGAYAEKKIFPGGCFFSAASLEFDDRPGKVRDLIVDRMNHWLLLLEEAVRQGQFSGEIRKDIDARLVAFEFHALAMGGNWRSRLFGDDKAFRMVGQVISNRLEEITEKPSARK